MSGSAAELYSTKADFAYLQVKELILSGKLLPGSVIAQAQLARDIGISTTPLREALRRLKSEGLVELDAHRDARVAPLAAEEARDLLELRRSLDPLAVALAAERRTKADIAAMRAAHDGLRPLPGNPAIEQLVAHRKFHTALYSASHNDLLIQTLDGLWDKADRYRRLALEVERGQAARDRKAEEHEALLEYVIAGDAESAAAVMREHIDTSLGAQAAWRLRKHPTASDTATSAPGTSDPATSDPGTPTLGTQGPGASGGRAPGSGTPGSGASGPGASGPAGPSSGGPSSGGPSSGGPSSAGEGLGDA